MATFLCKLVPTKGSTTVPYSLEESLEQSPDFKRDLAALFIVRDVVFHPSWSLEVEEVCEAPVDRLPDDLSPRARCWLDQVSPMLENSGAVRGESKHP